LISGIADIKTSGKIPSHRVGIVAGTAIEDYYLRRVSGNQKNYYPLRSQDEIYPALMDKIIDASISDSGLLECAINNLYCNLTLDGTDFNPSAYGIVMRKDWLYAEAVDIVILSLRKSGSDLDLLKRRWFRSSSY